MLNHIDIMGRLGKDPELRHTNSGKAVASFSLAVERDFKNQDGTRTTDWIDCVAWGNTAEFVSRNFSKGRMAAVSGSLQMRKWTDKNGQNRISSEVNASNVYFADSKLKEAAQEFTPLPDDTDVPFTDSLPDGDLPF